MPKYMILHNAQEPASEFMARFSPKKMWAGMDAWVTWKNEAEKTVKFESCMPCPAIHHTRAYCIYPPSDR